MPCRKLRENLGALQERDFRLLFSGTVITTVGDRLAGIALAFAVLDIGSATDLGHRLRGAPGRRGARARLRRRALRPAAAEPRDRRRVARAGGGAGGDGRRSSSRAAARSRRSWRSRASTASAAGSSFRPRSGSCRRRSAPARLQQANALQGLSRNLDGGPRAGDRRRARRRRQPGHRPRHRRGQLRRLRRDPVPDPDRAAAPRSEQRGLHPRAARGLEGVHLANVAVGVGRPVRDRQPRRSARGSCSGR